jgi:hypothetical protein
MDVNKPPTPFSERIVKEKMPQIFFSISIIENTIVILKFHVFPFE